jgi:predicted transposase/invertase (TIGR01784 family)
MDYKLKQGIKIGKEEGRAEEKISMARIMKSSGEPVDKIVKYTGLTEEEINNL